MDHAHGADRERDPRQAGDQDSAGAEPVDQEADRGLQDTGGDRINRQQQAELGIAQGELRLDQGKQRRQRQAVKMAPEVGAADQSDGPDVVADRWRQRGHWAVIGQSLGGRRAARRHGRTAAIAAR